MTTPETTPFHQSQPASSVQPVDKSALDILFRFRFALHIVIYGLAFWAPWNAVLHIDSAGLSTWLVLASWPARNGWLNFTASTVTFLALGIAFTFAGALLRTWGAAYPGACVVHDDHLHGQQGVADGPYRHLRHPRSLGTLLHTVALTLLMPPSGAIFALIFIPLLQFTLIAAEERSPARTRGPEYLAYKHRVPCILPSLRPRVPASGQAPQWPQAFLGETYMWGAVISFAVLGWRYNAFLVTRGIIISLGVSLVARAFLTRPAQRGGN